MLIRNTNRSSLRFALAFAAVAAVSQGTASTAYSQTQSMFGNRGPANQIGSNLRGSMVGRGTTFGATGGTGLTGQPLSGAAGSSTLGGRQQQGAGTGFVGRGDDGAFIGNNQRTGQQANRGNARRGGANLGNRAAQRTGTNFGNDQPNRNGTTSQRVIRPRQKIAFDFPRRPGTTVSSDLNVRYQQLSSSQRSFSEVSVTVDAEGTATLVGSVDSAESARLAELMARLEPGVRNVQNELTIIGADTEPE